MNMKKPVLLLLTLLLCVFSGCSGKEKPFTPTGDALQMQDGSTIGSRPQEKPEEQVLTMVYYPGRSMNPLESTDFTNRALFSLIYQGLFNVDRDYQTEPILCKQYALSEDMKTYTFYLEDARFSDGSAVTDADVVASLQAAEKSDYYEGRFHHITDIKVGSEGGVVIELDTPYENLPILLDIPIVKASQVKDEKPLGSGPYAFVMGTGGARLQRQSNWWCDADLVTTAQGITLIEAKSANQIRDEFEFGDLDIVCANPASDNYADYRCDYELWDCENGSFLYLGCNLDSDVFSDPKVRSALTFAIDRDKLANTYYRGFGRSATLPASPKSPYYSQTLADRYRYDSVKFAEALDSSGKSGSSIIFLVNKDDSLRLRTARAVADMLRDCGLKIEMKEQRTADYQESIIYHTYDIYLGQTRLSTNMDLTAFFHPYGTLSYGHMEDGAIYAMCLDALANSGNYYKLHQMVAEDGRMCPVLFCGYAIYGTRGVLTELKPARDQVFYYSLGKSMKEALII